MRAFHVYSTKPSRTWFGRNQPDSTCSFEDFELLAMMLSALKWRQHNGTIKMYTDSAGADYFRDIGLDTLWNAGLDTSTLELSDLNTSETVFWAYARTIALQQETCPCFCMDLDLIVWKDISSLLTSDFMAIHKEQLDFAVYVPREQLHIHPDYTWDEWDWTIDPCNAALLYFGRAHLKEMCCSKGIQYMQNNIIERELTHLPAHAVFVEQRLYPMCAAKLNIPSTYFLNSFRGDTLSNGQANDRFTHLWLYKARLMIDRAMREQICLRMIGRIKSDFPALERVLHKIPNVRDYL